MKAKVLTIAYMTLCYLAVYLTELISYSKLVSMELLNHKVWGCNSVVEYLPRMFKALDSISSHAKK
jgi:hypothetical protein